MTARAVSVTLCAAALWAAAAPAHGATGAASPAGGGIAAHSPAVAGGPGPSAASTSTRRKRARRPCRKAKRHARTPRSGSRRGATRRGRICRRRRARRRPVVTPAPNPIAAPAPVPTPTVTPPLIQAPPAPLARYVSVQAREFYYTLSRPLVGTGEVTIEFRNDGEDPHNLVVSPEGTHDALTAFLDQDPAVVSSTTLTLQPGRYYLWCSLEGHEAAGMHATLRVE